MKRNSGRRRRFDLESLRLDKSSPLPLYRQLENQIRDAITEGRLRPGQTMPSTRRFARDLEVARNTVANAYDQLVVEGYLVSAEGSGTRVSDLLPEALLHAAEPPRETPREPIEFPLSSAADRIRTVNTWIKDEVDRPVRPFRAHTPASDAFPRGVWTQLTARRLRSMSRSFMERADPRGYRPLREAIAAYLGTARGVRCTADNIVITAGAQQGVELLAKLLVEPGDTVVMEEPGYAPAGLVFELAGASVVSVPVDEEGLDVARLQKTVPAAKLVYVTPSSQFPCGMTMSLRRRLALLTWADETGAIVLEDDYNGEYRYTGRPITALHRLAAPGRVVYMGSFSKLLFPSLRIGYLVVPAEALSYFAAARWLVDRHSPPIEQAVLTDFINDGHFARHVRKMRTLYEERQRALVTAARETLSDVLEVAPMDAGLHLIGRLVPPYTEEVLLAAAASVGIEIMPTSWFRSAPSDSASVLLGYAPFNPREIDLAVSALRRACDTVSVPGAAHAGGEAALRPRSASNSERLRSRPQR